MQQRSPYPTKHRTLFNYNPWFVMGVKNNSTVSLQVRLHSAADAIILIPRGCDPSGLYQKLRPLAASNTGSPHFTGSLSNLTNLIGCKLQREYSAHVQKFGVARGLDLWHRPEGLWAPGMRMQTPSFEHHCNSKRPCVGFITKDKIIICKHFCLYMGERVSKIQTNSWT